VEVKIVKCLIKNLNERNNSVSRLKVGGIIDSADYCLINTYVYVLISCRSNVNQIPKSVINYRINLYFAELVVRIENIINTSQNLKNY